MLKKIQQFIIATIVFVVITGCEPSPEKLVKNGKNHIKKEKYTEAMACFKKAAEKGNAEAEYQIGKMYLYGYGVVVCEDVAAEWFLKSASNNYGDAQNILSLMYYTGQGVTVDYKKAEKWAVQALEKEEYVESTIVLGMLYYYGLGVTRNYTKAVELLQNVADDDKCGDIASELLFGMYLNGLGTPQNEDKAVTMYCNWKKVSETQAAYDVGMMFYQGNGVKQDYLKAEKLLKKASGDSLYRKQAGVVLFEMCLKGLGRPKDVDKAIEIYCELLNVDEAKAMCDIGTFYFEGNGVKKSIKEAKQWWQQSANKGNKEALNMLSKLKTFSVSSNRKVVFSKGNLQYKASTKTWRFAEHKWDYVGTQTPDYYGCVGGTVSGSDNSLISYAYDGWIDLFGYGTGDKPALCSKDNVDYTDFNDWGDNRIINGDGKKWRTLTIAEWNYLFYNRPTYSGMRYVYADVNDVSGAIILPDYWDNSLYKLKACTDEDALNADFSRNTISRKSWIDIFEANGAVFLPAAGVRHGTYVSGVGYIGGYWKKRSYTSDGVWVEWSSYDFDSFGFHGTKTIGSAGKSVRLVNDV